MSLLYKIENLFRNNLFKINGKILTFYFRIHGCKVGRNLRCHNFPIFRISPNKNIFIGNNVVIGYNITIEVTKNGSLILNDNVYLSQNIIISSNKKILIGKNTIIAENVSIRDSNHIVRKSQIIRLQPIESHPIYIGEDVWIAAGCVILLGSNINNGVVIGCNSVVTRGCITNPYKIYAGSPVNQIKERT